MRDSFAPDPSSRPRPNGEDQGQALYQSLRVQNSSGVELAVHRGRCRKYFHAVVRKEAIKSGKQSEEREWRDYYDKVMPFV